MQTVEKWVSNSKFLFVIEQLVPREHVWGFLRFFWLSLWLGVTAKTGKKSFQIKM